MICLDASFLVNVFLGRLQEDDTARWVEWRRMRRPMIARLLMRYEVSNVMHKMRRRGTAEELVIQRALQDLLMMPLTYIDDDQLVLDAVAIARDFDLPAAYDAHYLALATRYRAEVWTSDRRMWETASKHVDWVHYAPELVAKE